MEAARLLAALGWDEASSSLSAAPSSISSPPAPTSIDTIMASAAQALSLLGDSAARIDGPRLLRRADSSQGPVPGGRRSVTGSSYLFRASDEWLAMTLAREWDREALPAISQGALDGACSAAELEAFVRSAPAASVVRRVRLLDVPAARLGEEAHNSMPWQLRPLGKASRRRRAAPRVLDISSLWAGPLCGWILQAVGCDVLKIESVDRPDAGTHRLFPELNQGKETIRIDLTAEDGRARMQELCRDADLVIASCRQRVAGRLGLLPSGRSGGAPVTIAISGYGWLSEKRHQVAFGDDAAVAGGLVGWEFDRTPVFLGDAIADPLTGLFAAVAGMAALQDGRAWFIDAPLTRAAAYAAARLGSSQNYSATASPALATSMSSV